ncbi:hypothetical protein OH77DRAFT_1520619 [Trametes cingulata]|nr:hypothetical protein OH77DRAFT_1520619 [Trametes cingulata]
MSQTSMSLSPSIATLDDNSLEAWIDGWLAAQANPSCEPDESQPANPAVHMVMPSSDEFDREIDETNFEVSPYGPTDAQRTATVGEAADWWQYFNFQGPSTPSTPEASSLSAYSDEYSSTLSTTSALTEKTFVNPTDPSAADSAVNTGVDLQKLQFGGDALTPDPGVHYYYPFDPNLPVTYSHVSPPPSIDDTPLAYPWPGSMTHGQPLQQHLPGATAASAYVDRSTQADDVPLTTQPLISAVEASPSNPVDVASPGTSKRKRESDTVDEEKPKKRRKPQSTEKTLICPECGSGWARKNNLTQHVKSVHLGLRMFACPEPGCGREFSRNNDMKRHFQSRHTDLGSPRRKTPQA